VLAAPLPTAATVAAVEIHILAIRLWLMLRVGSVDVLMLMVLVGGKVDKPQHPQVT
jgi:hypothetical protein